jgi:superfamily I DNA/RNA helicase
MTPALTQLIDDVRARRAADPVGPLALVAPSRLLAAHLRRTLARALGGIVNVQSLTLPDLAERIAALHLARAGRRPLPPVGERLVVGEAIRIAVPATGGYFSAVARLPNFPATLGRTLEDLKKAGIRPEALEAAAADSPAGSPRATKLRELGACYRAREAILASQAYYDTSDLLGAAADLVAETPRRLGVRAVYVVGFIELNRLEQRLLDACRGAAPVVSCPGEIEGVAVPGAGGLEIVAAAGEEREVREIARAVLRHVADGGRFDDVGVLLPEPVRYRSAVREVFGTSGIPYAWGGRAAPPLAETRTGRSLLVCLETRRARFSRAAVMEFLEFADLVPGSGVSPAEWGRLSRQAGIVGGARAWRERLGWLRSGLEAAERQAGETGEADATRARDRAALAALSRRVALLIRELGRVPDEGPIEAFAEPLGRAFRRLVRRTAERDQALGALASLAPLGSLQARLSIDDFRALLEGALARPREPEAGATAAREPGAVFVGDLAEASGLAFPLTVLAGVAEGSLPAAVRQDPILLDAERCRWPDLPLSTRSRELERMRFRLAVGSGAERLLLTYPRLDAGSSRPRVPSFLLLDLLREVTGERQDFGTLERFPGFRAVPLHPAPGPARALPLDEREWLVTRALAARGEPDAFLAGLPGAARGWAAIEARERTPRLTPFDGLLERGVRLDETPLAPTWLETYATCPFRFFLGRVLRVVPVEEPDRILTLDPAERGRLVHEALETAFRSLVEAGELPVTAERLPAAHAHLDAALDVAFARAERRGVTGLPALWEGEKTRLRAALRSALSTEVAEAAEWVPACFEVAFGLPWLDAALPPVPYQLPDGSALHFRGRLDRLDRSRDGTRARVIDYKTGRARGGTRADRLARGRALQLPIYRLAAEAYLAALGEVCEVVEAQYYHLIGADAGTRVRFTRRGWDSRREDFDRVLGLIAEGIGRGRFFARPDVCARNTPCEFDLACGAEGRRWMAAKAMDSAVLRHAELDAVE